MTNYPTTMNTPRNKVQKVLRAMCKDYGATKVARHYGCSRAQMSRIVAGTSGASVEGLIRVSVWYANRGDRRLAALFDASSGPQSVMCLVNGSVDDEALEIHDATSRMRAAYHSDPNLFLQAVRQLNSFVERVRAEGLAKWRATA